MVRKQSKSNSQQSEKSNSIPSDYSDDAFQTDRINLLDWYQKAKRDLPWRRTSDPYRIWLSEIMLQQTRVDQAIPYYQRFVDRFPDVSSLAEADLDNVLKLWEGLGYYSRARNMHQAAKQIVKNHGGRFPETHQDVIALQGVGPYTAAAVMSIAFDKAYAVVDGNVTRVLCRIFGIEGDVRTAAAKKQVAVNADLFLDPSRPGDFNQAVMELGAVVCTPVKPDCSNCPLQTSCLACQHNLTAELPYKSPAKKRPHHQIAVGVVRNEMGQLLIARRPDNAMLGGLWEFPGGKQEPGESLTDTVCRELQEELGVDVTVDTEPFEVIRHAYSHFTITLHAFFAKIPGTSPPPETKNKEPFCWVEPEELADFAFPKANRKITDSIVKYHACGSNDSNSQTGTTGKSSYLKSSNS